MAVTTAGALRLRRIGALVPKAWPAYALFYGFPLWWILGLGAFCWMILAVPMLFDLLRRDHVVAPRGFGFWLLFLGWMLLSAMKLGSNTPGVVGGSGSSHVTSYAFRALLYFSITILFLYLCNLPRQQLPTRALVSMLSFMFLVTVAGGFAGILLPNVTITTPAEKLLPRSLATNEAVNNLVHPGMAEVQGILGYSTPRPKAPYEYTNEWGANYSLLLPFFVLAWVQSRSRRKRWLGPGVLVLSLIPLIYSLNRGVWLAIGLALLYVAVRLALQGRTVALGGIMLVAAVVGLAVVATPLNKLINDRIGHPHSNDRRAFLYKEAFDGAVDSPLLGWGTVRPSNGNSQSITRAKTANCKACGAPPIGTHGQFWLVLFSQGFVGATLFTMFFVSILWRLRSDQSWVGIWTSVVLLLTLMEMFIYNQIPATLHFVAAALAVWWRFDQERRDTAGRAGGPPLTASLPGPPALPERAAIALPVGSA